MTIFQFQPSAIAPFQFQPILDGVSYTATVVWNLFGQRWYLRLAAADGTPVVNMPLMGSSNARSLSSLTWDQASTEVLAVTADPHGFPLGSLIKLTVSNAVPADYNGSFLCSIQSPTSFSYTLTSAPGAATAVGAYGYDINIAAGYFNTSTLVWRDAANVFEVLP